MNKNKLKSQLGIKIQQLRNKIGLTQEEFSENIGITQRQVSLIELGKSFPSPETLSNIVNFCSCSMRDLFDFEPIENIENLKNEFINIIKILPDDKLKILYVISKNI